MRLPLLATVLAIVELCPAAAIWPFDQNRFVIEALIDAGPLGLEEVTGRVVAVGDWNGDQKWAQSPFAARTQWLKSSGKTRSIHAE